MLVEAAVILAGPLLIVGIILYNYANANLDDIRKDWV
jgi:hypothetical protein